MFLSGEPFSSLVEAFPLNKHQERMLLELLLLTVLVNAVLLSTSTVPGQTSLRRRSRYCELAATSDEGVRLSLSEKVCAATLRPSAASPWTHVICCDRQIPVLRHQTGGVEKYPHIHPPQKKNNKMSEEKETEAEGGRET